MSRMTTQGKLGLGMLTGLLVAVAVTAAILAMRDTEPPTRDISGITVAKVVLPAAADAWVADDGELVLVQDGDNYRLAKFGPGGEIESHPVDAVSVLDDHRVYVIDDTVVIDESQYTLTDGTWVEGDCYWCSHEFPGQVVIADLKDGTWKVTFGDQVSTVDQPGDWDGRQPTAGFTSDGAVIVVAGLKSGDTAVIEELTCIAKGSWAFMAADADVVLLHKVDADRLDYSVSSFGRCV